MKLVAQDRASGNIIDYLEVENVSSSDDEFETGEITTTFNDQVSTVSPN